MSSRKGRVIRNVYTVRGDSTLDSWGDNRTEIGCRGSRDYVPTGWFNSRDCVSFDPNFMFVNATAMFVNAKMR